MLESSSGMKCLNKVKIKQNVHNNLAVLINFVEYSKTLYIQPETQVSQ